MSGDSRSPTQLYTQVLRRSGSAKEQAYAKTIEPVRHLYNSLTSEPHHAFDRQIIAMVYPAGHQKTALAISDPGLGECCSYRGQDRTAVPMLASILVTCTAQST